MVLLCTSMNWDFEEISEFEWDEGNLAHIKKHGVTDKECEEIFLNEPFYYEEDQGHSVSETRFEAFGGTDANRKIFLIFTIRNNKIRVVSTRDQNKKERRNYEKVKKNTGS